MFFDEKRVIGQEPIVQCTGYSALPNGLREKLLQTDREKTILTLEVIYYCGWRGGQEVTHGLVMEKARALGISVCTELVREGLKDRIFEFRTVGTGKRGRPWGVYRVPDIFPLLQAECDGQGGTSDRLYAEDLRDIPRYRIGLHREFIKRNSGKKFPRRFLAGRLGVSMKATVRYEKFLPMIKAEATFVIRRITAMTDLKAVFRVVERGRDCLKVLSNGHCYTFPAVFSIAQNFIRPGCQVEIWRRDANRYYWGDIPDGSRYVTGQYADWIES
jgi:hypothetical protein